MELTELTRFFEGTGFRVFASAIAAGGYVGAVVMPGGAAQTRKELDGWHDWAKARALHYELQPLTEDQKRNNVLRLAFGNDGYLYVSSGDGTSDSDTNLTGQKISDRDFKALPVTRHDWHGDWNYTVHPP